MVLAVTLKPAAPGAIWLWGLAGAAVVVILILLIKIRLLQKAAEEIQQAFTERLDIETNTLIDISTGDRHMRNLAAALNRELVRLRAQRRRFLQGDQELKSAVTNISHDLRTLSPLSAAIWICWKQNKKGLWPPPATLQSYGIAPRL